MTDTERLDWLEQHGDGMALISDDNGHWTVTGDGMQNCPIGDEKQDIETVFFIEADGWSDSIREAIDRAIGGG